MNLDMATLGYSFVEACLRRLGGDGGTMLVGFFFSAVLYLFVTRKTRWKRFFLPYLAVLLVTVFNPYLMKPIIEKMGLSGEYYRFFWLLPMVILVAFVGTKVVLSQKGKWMQAVLLAVCVGMLMTTGTTLLSKGYPRATNIYKVPEELIEINEIMKAHNEKLRKEGTEWGTVKAVYDLNMNILAKQYEPEIEVTLPYEIMQSVRATGEGEQPGDPVWLQMRKRLAEALILEREIEIEGFMSALNVTKTQYIVYPIDGNMNAYISGAGSYEVARTEHYIIWCYSYAKPDDYIDENL